MKPKNGTLVRNKDGSEDLVDSVKVDVTAWTVDSTVVVLTVWMDDTYFDMRLSGAQAKKLAKALAYIPE